MQQKVLMNLFLLFAALCQHIIFLDGLILIPDKSFCHSDMKKFKDWNGNIFEIQEDLMNDGFILIGSNAQIISTDGNTIVVVAGNDTQGYAEGEKDIAMFDGVTGLIQINQTTLVVSDYNNHCLRIVDRQLQTTAVYAGMCTFSGMRDGDAENAQFREPSGILMVNTSIYVGDRQNDAIRMVNVATMVVSTIAVEVNRPSFLLFHSAGYLLVSTYKGFTKVTLATGQTVDLTKSTETGYDDGDLQNARFHRPEGMIWIADDVFLVADVNNDARRMINVTSSKVSTLCSATGFCESKPGWSLLLRHDTLLVGTWGGVVTYKLSPLVQSTVETTKSGLITGVIIGIVLLAVTVIIITLIAWRRKRTRRNIDNSSKIELQGLAAGSKDNEQETGDTAVHIGLKSKLSSDLRLLVDECMMFNVIMTSEELIGTGFFGKVCKCEMKREDGSQIMVAVKMLKYENTVLSEVERFLKEATIMKNFHHPNVLELLGIIWDQDQPKVVLPLMENGDLKSTLKREDFNFTLRDLLNFVLQLCSGMEYLESKRFVHCDLSARNCVVSSTFIVKIADFGLSVDVYVQEYYRSKDLEKPMPIRWMAIESILEGIYSSKSDVWSFGVTVWEILTRGSLPYPAVESHDIRRCIMLGERLHQPRFCPNPVYDIMQMCWLEKPDDRPSFSSLTKALKSILNPKGIPVNEPAYDTVRISTIQDPDEYLYSYVGADALSSTICS